MENKNKICQSCGIPLDKDPNRGGNNADKSKSGKYCSFCYMDGKFYDEGISLKEKIEKNIRIAVSQGSMTESQARMQAESLLPTLDRWRRK